MSDVLTLRLAPADLEALAARAAAVGMSRSEYVRQAIAIGAQALARHHATKNPKRSPQWPAQA